jgi:hypothetical protein
MLSDGMKKKYTGEKAQHTVWGRIENNGLHGASAFLQQSLLLI